MDDKGIRDTLNDDRLQFDEPSHTYTWEGEECLTSVTTLLKGFFPFDADAVATDLGKRSRNPKYKGKSKEEILQLWDDKRELGSRVHLFIENYLKGEFVEITCPREQGIYNWLQRFNYEDAIPEQIICHPHWGVAGMIDALIKIKGKWYIYDWKTDARIDTQGFKGEMCTGELCMFPKCNFTKYQFQLSIYNLLLSTSRYDIDIAGLKVVHISEEGICKEYTVPYLPDWAGVVVRNFVDKKGSFKPQENDS
jgi:hypothetical protein